MIQLQEENHRASNTKSVSKTLAILSVFNEQPHMFRTSDIALKLHMDISTVSRHLNTMLDWGFLERDDPTGCYYPGLKIITLAGSALQNHSVFRHASHELQELSHQYGVHSYLSVPRDCEIIYLISNCCESTMDLLIPIGHCHPMYCSAMGRVMLANMPAAKVNSILKNSQIQKYTDKTKTEISEINQELVLARQKGYCKIDNELVGNKASLAGAIFNYNREPIAAISVSESAHSLAQPGREVELATAIMTTAGRISGNLGYYPK